jgi:hypothetical protein
MADSSCGVTLVKQFTYRGDASEEYSNTYWFSGSTPADAIAWKALADAIIAQEKTCYPAGVKVVRAYGYDSPNDTDGEHAAWSYDYLGAAESVVGTWATGTFIPQGGDAAVWVRWRTTRRTSPGGKLIYLRKYFHPAYGPSTGGDTIASTLKTALAAFGVKMIDGTLPSARKLCAMHHTEDAADFAADDVEACSFITTRTLKRRGKRNPTT